MKKAFTLYETVLKYSIYFYILICSYLLLIISIYASKFNTISYTAYLFIYKKITHSFIYHFFQHTILFAYIPQKKLKALNEALCAYTCFIRINIRKSFLAYFVKSWCIMLPILEKTEILYYISVNNFLNNTAFHFLSYTLKRVTVYIDFVSQSEGNR